MNSSKDISRKYSRIKIRKPTIEKIKQGLGLFDSVYDSVVCIGTPKVEYDSLAPRIGSNLSRNNLNTAIIGTVENPVDRTGIEIVASSLVSSNVLAIDSAEGGLFDRLGSVIIEDGAIEPASASCRTNVYIGNISLKIVTSKKGLFGKKYLNKSQLDNLVIILSKALSEVL